MAKIIYRVHLKSPGDIARERAWNVVLRHMNGDISGLGLTADVHGYYDEVTKMAFLVVLGNDYPIAFDEFLLLERAGMGSRI